jgi:hypothetical protein
MGMVWLKFASPIYFKRKRQNKGKIESFHRLIAQKSLLNGAFCSLVNADGTLTG